METTKFTDYFSLLGVDKDATAEDIRKAFMSKALIYHPDKVGHAGNKNIYQDLKEAYRILSNDNSKKQYIDSQQTTYLDFKKESRDHSYVHTDKFTKITEDGLKFDNDAFMNTFDKNRDSLAAETLSKLQAQTASVETKVTTLDYAALMNKRRQELASFDAQTTQFLPGNGDMFDSNTFNRAFDVMKKQNPGNEIQDYTGVPASLFSTGGLDETDTFGTLSMQHGFGFSGVTMDNLIQGAPVNQFTMSGLDLEKLNTGQLYGQEGKISYSDVQDRVKLVTMDRRTLACMKKEQFTAEPSEIEKMYSELFAPSEVEGLDAPADTCRTDLDMVDTNIGDDLPSITHIESSSEVSNKIRQKINANYR